jgi:hypothetical protein
MIWADEEDTVSTYLHANFKLSATGESLMLSDGAGLVLDSLTFGPQTADISLGRCPNGSGLFTDLEFPTFGTDNYCPDYISDQKVNDQKILVMPNPFRDHFTLLSDDPETFSAEIFNSSGLQVAKEKFESGVVRFNAFYLPAGIYFYIIRDDKNEVLCSGKIVKIK